MNKKSNKATLILMTIYTLLLVACTQNSNSTQPPQTPKGDSPSPETRLLNPQPPKQATTAHQDTFVSTHSEKEIQHFLDSLAKRPISNFTKFIPTGTLPKKGIPCPKTLTEQQFVKLKQACKSGRISMQWAKSIFPDINTSNLFQFGAKKDSGYIHCFHLEKGETFDEYAVGLGDTDQAYSTWLYFFKGKNMIERHEVVYRYELSVDHYQLPNGETALYYLDCMASGAGSWQFNYNFYHFDSLGLVPLLKTMSDASWQNGRRTYEMNSMIRSTSPLRIRYWFEQHLGGARLGDGGGDIQDIINDSTTISFALDSALTHYDANWAQSKLTQHQMFTYYSEENDLLFIRTHTPLLKSLIASSDKHKRDAVVFYLRAVMAGNYPKGYSAKR